MSLKKELIELLSKYGYDSKHEDFFLKTQLEDFLIAYEKTKARYEK